MLFACLLVKSQQVDWNMINSQNALEMIAAQTPNQAISASSVIQIGNANQADLMLNSKTNIIIQQLGDQNSIYFNNAFTEKETKATISTQGYNNIVDVTGSNSISDKLQLTIKGENMTVFMRNY